MKTNNKFKWPGSIYLLKVNNRNTRTRCEICSNLTIKTPARRHWRRSGVFIFKLEQMSYLVLVFLLLLWTVKCPLGKHGIFRSTSIHKQPPEVFNEKRCSQKFCKIHRKTWKHLCQSLFFNKVAGLGLQLC